MTKLVCDFSSFNSLKSNISSKVEEYNSLLNALTNLENISSDFWNSSSQKTFYSKFMQRKTELEQLSKDYSSMVELLNDIITTYENIENSF